MNASKFSKADGLKKIDDKIARITDLKKMKSGSSEFQKWHRDARVLLGRLFGEDHQYVKDFNDISYSLLMFGDGTPDSVWEEAYADGLTSAKAMLVSVRGEIDEFWPEESAGPIAVDKLEIIATICRRFRNFAAQIQIRREGRSTIAFNDEYDVQDAFHALLKLFFDDVRKEEWTPSYAGKSSRVDFLLKAEKVVVEIKMTRDGLADRQLGEQLIIDIERYRAHPDCQALICFVYDPDHRVTNPAGLEADLRGIRNGLDVKVWIYPK